MKTFVQEWWKFWLACAATGFNIGGAIAAAFSDQEIASLIWAIGAMAGVWFMREFYPRR